MAITENCRKALVALLTQDAQTKMEFGDNVPTVARAQAMAMTAAQLAQVPKLSHKVGEVYTNSLISAFATPIVNAMSAFRMASDIGTKYMAASLNVIPGANKALEDVPTFKEANEFAKAALFAPISAFDEISYFLKAGWKAGKPLDTGLDQSSYRAVGAGLKIGDSVFESPEWEKKAAKVVQAPTQMGVAIDEAMKAYYRRVKLYELISKAQTRFPEERLEKMGMSRNDLVMRLRQIADNPMRDHNYAWTNELKSVDPSLFDEVTNFAKKQTFQEEPPEMIKTIMRMREKHPFIGSIIFPFIRTPFNIGKQAMSYVPGVAPLMSAFKRNAETGAAQFDPRLHAEDIAKSMLGATSMFLIADQMDKGNLTVGYSKDADVREGQIASGTPEYGIKIGGKWFDWGRVEPIASFLIAAGTAVDGYKEYEKKKASGKDPDLKAVEELSAVAADAFSKAFVQRQFLYGLSTFLGGVTGDEAKAEQWGTSIAANLLTPAAIAQVARASDPNMRKVDSVGNALKNRIPGLRQTLPVEYAAYGGPRENPQYGAKAFLPILGKANQEQTDLQKFTQEIGYSPMPVSKKLRGVELTMKQWERLDELASNATEKVLSGAYERIKNMDASADRKKYLMEKLTNKAREMARKQALSEFLKDPVFREKYITAKREGKGIFAEDL